MMFASFEGSSPPRIGLPEPVLNLPTGFLFDCDPVRCYEVAPDGQFFYVTDTRWPPPKPAVTHVNVVQNWVEELKRKFSGPSPR